MNCSLCVKCPAAEIAWPIIGVVLISAFGEIALNVGFVQTWQSAQYVVLCALVANRLSMRAGFFCAAFSMIVHVYVFMPTRWGWDVPMAGQMIAYVCMVLSVPAVGRRPQSPRDPPPVVDGTLPFVSEKGATSDDDARYWSTPGPTGDWHADTALGAEYGRTYIDRWRSTGGGPILGWVVRSMVRRGQWSGIEAGFIGAIGRKALRDMAPARRQPLLLPRPGDDPDNAHPQSPVIKL